MCQLTILLYTQCNCGPRDGSYEDGFIVTKDSYDRLFLNLDPKTVPFERCAQAKFFALSPNRSDTVEFPRCHNVRVKTIRIDGQPCFGCLTRREINKRTERIKTLHTERKVLRGRLDALKNAEVKDAEFTRTMRQTMKESPQFDKRTEKQKFYGTKVELSTVKFGSVKGMVADWEKALHKQIKGQMSAKKKSAEKRAGVVTSEESKSDEKKKRDKVTLIGSLLPHFNQHEISPLVNEHGTPPPYEETEQDSCIQKKPLQRLRISRPVRSVPSGTGPRLDLMVPVKIMQNLQEASSAQNTSTPTKSSTAVTTTTQTPGRPSPTDAVVKYHTVGGGRVISPSAWITEQRFGRVSSKSVETAPNRSLTGAAADAPKFRPFQRPPPTEPRMMRAPTAPRALREGSAYQSIWQPRRQFATYRGYSTYRSWRG